MAEGININEKDVQKENVPDDLNSLAVGSYVIPNPLRSCLLYTSPSPRDPKTSRMPSSA